MDLISAGTQTVINLNVDLRKTHITQKNDEIY